MVIKGLNTHFSGIAQVLFVFVLIVLCSCGGGASKSSSKTDNDKQSNHHFALPEIPAMVTGADNRLLYMVQHYWDNFDFEDPLQFENDSLVGVAAAGYIQVLAKADSSAIQSSVNAVLGRALQIGYDSFERLTSVFEKYLYDPNSPMRNEELYIYVLRYFTEVAELEDIYKLRAEKQLEMVLKNRVGEVANDFSYTTSEGVKSNLYSVKSPYTILFFNTPDCDDCKRVKEYIGGSQLFNSMVQQGNLVILGLYTESDVELWQGAVYPNLMINAIDTGCTITANRSYDLKALPTLYLLDSDKKVVLKDRSVEEIEYYLKRIDK